MTTDNQLMLTLPVITSDGWDELEGGNSFIRGMRIRFSQGDFFCANGASVSSEERFGVVGVKKGWQRWCDGRAETRITLPGQIHPSRDEIGDTNEALWPLNKDGRKEDPWCDVRAVHMVSAANLQEYTFVTQTYGGRKSVAELGEKIRRMRMRYPNARPIIVLRHEKMRTKQGSALKPVLSVDEWHGLEGPDDLTKLCS